MDEATLSGNNEVYELNENGDITHYFKMLKIMV